ncbi:MAG: hypothetical protein OXN94_02685 [Chloroflexota bacterium]|nr:hypothetical protein [Chloroflexota bacterium]MDE2856733.1 hypothetical protein [Chloroflexota bacterium]MDE2950036.1 hypothetical protein [Chloroflexota bacterium]
MMKIFVSFVKLLLLYVQYIYLHICYFFLKVAGALLLEAAKIEIYIKFMTKEERIKFAACIAVSIYILMLILLIRM